MRWHSIASEGYPCYGVGVLVSDGMCITIAQRIHLSGLDMWTGYNWSGYEWDFDFNEEAITHWMDLPSAPHEG